MVPVKYARRALVQERSRRQKCESAASVRLPGPAKPAQMDSVLQPFRNCLVQSLRRGTAARRLSAGLSKIGHQIVGGRKASLAHRCDLVSLGHCRTSDRVGHLQFERKCLIGDDTLEEKAHGIGHLHPHRIKRDRRPVSDLRKRSYPPSFPYSSGALKLNLAGAAAPNAKFATRLVFAFMRKL